MGLKIGMGTDTRPPDMMMNMQVGMILCRVMENDPAACRAEDYSTPRRSAAPMRSAAPISAVSPRARAPTSRCSTSTAPHLGQVIDPIQTLLIAGRGTDARTVIVDGRASVQEGMVPGVVWSEWAARAKAQFERLLALYPHRTWGHPALGDIFSAAYPTVRPSAAASA